MVEHADATASSGAPAPSGACHAIEVRGLQKSYGTVRAVAGVDLDVAEGEVFALLGPNGAGKSTTVEILEGYRAADAGTVTVLGRDPRHDRAALSRHVGIVLQSTGLDRYLTVAETLTMYAGYYPHPREVGDVLELVGLSAQRDMRVLRLSGGQQRRLDVGIALVGDPDLLFLDEPTTGFDPAARHEAWHMIKDLARLGKTVLLTTHYMDEAQQLADRVAVIVAGRIVALGTPGDLGGRAAIRPTVRLLAPAGEGPPIADPVTHAPDGYLEFQPADLTAALAMLTAWAGSRPAGLDSLEIVRPSLEDVYMQLVGDGTVDGGAP